MQQVDIIVAGAGIWGCTIARKAAEAGLKVLVLEKRPHIGGNARCEIDDETGIEIHSYGSHIFHTRNQEVWDFINRFTTFNGYQHKVLASYKGRLYSLPVGLHLINKFFGVELRPSEVKDFMADENRSKAIFDAFFRGYTSKQWGTPPEQIAPAVINRIPVRSNYDTNYFNDYNQGIPLTGYNSLFANLLDHPNITVKCNAHVELRSGKFFSDGEELPRVPTCYSGAIDELFNYRHGALPWRTLRFEVEKLDIPDFQGTSIVNYPEAEVPYTRIHEFKHYHPENAPMMCLQKTIIMREYPKPWQQGDEPFYPIDNESSRTLLAKYKEEARRIPCLTIGGRLGEYKYYDMDSAMLSALNTPITPNEH